MTHVVVVGGGVMGSSAAWHLASRGADVTLLEQFAPGHTEGSSHGSSRIFRLGYPDASYVSLAARALPLWRQLEVETGTSVLTLTGAVDHGPADSVLAVQAVLAAAGRAVEVLGPDEAAERWPGLRLEDTAVFHPDAGRLHADNAVAAFQQAAVQRGAGVRHGVRVARLTRVDSGGVEVLTTQGELIAADAAVVAVGGWAPSLAAAAASGLPALRVTQEQPAHFRAEDPLAFPSFVHHGGGALLVEHGIYGLGSVDGVKIGRHAVGPVVDPDARDRTIDAVALQALQDYARTWLPGVDPDRPTGTTCLYTLTPDHDFVVDRDGPVTVLAGFSGHGFKFASVIGELAADLVDGRPGAGRFALGRHDRVPTP